jgi:inosine-uridine nucleoside N-ribohydrolase
MPKSRYPTARNIGESSQSLGHTTRMFKRRGSLLSILMVFASVGLAQVPIIFDTDMGNDIDDALALAVLHALADRGECRLLGVTLTNANAAAVPYVRMINRFYGRGTLPVGAAMRHVEGGDTDHYMSGALRTVPASHQIAAGEPTEQAISVLRRLLATSPDKVTIVQVGFSTNLAALLDSSADSISPKSGMELVRDKVALLSAMAGNFVAPQPEYNVKLDIPAARNVFERWPTPIVFSGFEIGRDLLYPAESIEKDFAYTAWHPVAVSYRAYGKMPYNRPSWDLTAALEAVRPGHQYFGHSAKGQVHVEQDGNTRFESGSGNRSYLILDPSSRARILEALRLLASQPPQASMAK